MDNPFGSARRLAAEALGTAFLLAAIVGSGIMADTLSGGNVGLALLANAAATAAALVILILVFGPVSGAHFNPAVTLAFLVRGEIAAGLAVAYVVAQVIGGVLGVWAVHVMFEQPVWQVAVNGRTGVGLWAAEVIATFGLVMTILGCVRWRIDMVAQAVGLYVGAAIWFTASTSFANPAVTIGRALTDTFTGIAPADVVPFIAAQIVGALLAVAVMGWLYAPAGKED